jgi:hypothetical protein
MKRVAIYARYSSENQRDALIKDQIEVCRRYAAQLGLQVTATFPGTGRSRAPAATGPATKRCWPERAAACSMS